MSDSSSIIVTIRSSGERTERACIQSVLNEGVGSDQIQIIKETPFKKALETCFQIASQSDAKWLLTLDADMVLLPGALAPFYREAQKIPDHFVQVQAQIFDKFYGEIRRGGPRLYRVQHLKKAFSISIALEDHIRPETNIIQQMGKKGHPSRYISPAIALHDFEQYYTDIYRKACVYAEKHIDKLPTILKEAVKNRETDPDYQVILKGIYDSLAKEMDIKIDKRMFVEHARQALMSLKLDEKEDDLVSFHIQELMETFDVPQPSFSFRMVEYKDVPSGYFNVFMATVRRNGLMRSFRIYLGLLLISLGGNLKQINGSGDQVEQ